MLANDPSSPGTSFTPFGTPTTFGDGTSVANGPDGLTLGHVDTDGRLDMVAWATRPAAADWEVYTASRPPSVTLSASAAKAFTGAPVTFTATASAASGSPQDATLDHVDWDFNGDGTIDQTTTTPTVAHAFTTTGDKPVSATYVNAAGDAVTVHLASAVRIGTPLAVTLSPKPARRRRDGDRLTASATAATGAGGLAVLRLHLHDGRRHHTAPQAGCCGPRGPAPCGRRRRQRSDGQRRAPGTRSRSASPTR